MFLQRDVITVRTATTLLFWENQFKVIIYSGASQAECQDVYTKNTLNEVIHLPRPVQEDTEGILPAQAAASGWDHTSREYCMPRIRPQIPTQKIRHSRLRSNKCTKILPSSNANNASQCIDCSLLHNHNIAMVIHNRSMDGAHENKP